MLKPIKKNSVVQIIEKSKETESGIILTVADPAEVTRGKVIEIGDEVELFYKGDTILPNWQKAKKTRFDGEDYYIVHEDDVVGVFDEVQWHPV
jgi:chaperonin GroES